MSEGKAIDKKEEKEVEKKAEKKEEEEEDVNEEGVKKKISYTYWVDDKNKSRELPVENRPKKIEAPIQPAAK